MSPLWIFGYGSLMWRPGFAYAERRHGYVEGFVRRFWQGSTDHRGVVGAPGRVVTLVEDPAGVCWGTAFRVSEAERERVLGTLDHREKGGYRRLTLPVIERDGADRLEALVYVATADNESYLGEATLEAIAAQVLAARGPSGSNVEYVVELAAAIRAIEGVADEHVFALEAAVRQACGGC